MKLELEICANSLPSALAAQQGGAIRIELCDNMAEGGTTPSYGTIKLAKEMLSIEVWPIIRPRGGDFLYNDLEFKIMKEDILMCKNLGCEGVVLGILLENGEIDQKRCETLVNLAKPMKCAFHRAFDLTSNPEKALEDLIRLNFVRVLTSGAESSAEQGIELLTKLVEIAKERIEIMPGAGINPHNIEKIKKQTKAKVFHASARSKVQSKMTFRKDKAKMGSADSEFYYEETLTENVAALLDALNTNDTC